MALIDIGSAKQLFVDDYLIESLTNAKQVMNPAEKVEHNPIVRPERPWEGNDTVPAHVYFDEKDQLFKMWYHARTLRFHEIEAGYEVEGVHDRTETTTCLATSEDGINWEKPALGLVEFEGSRENNILPPESVMPHTIPKEMLDRYDFPEEPLAHMLQFQDLHDDDPDRRYKGMVMAGTTRLPGFKIHLYYSADGLSWTQYENNPVYDASPRIGNWGPTHFMGWDPIRKTYAAHVESCQHPRCPLSKRLVGRSESSDLTDWSEPETILIPDEQDPPDTEFYGMPVIAYEGMYVGMLWNYRPTKNTFSSQIVFSRDGIHYNRNYREPFVPNGQREIDFDSAIAAPHAPIVYGDRIFTYYEGRNWRSPEMFMELGDKAIGAVGLAITPLDGFVSLDGGRGVGAHLVPDTPDLDAWSQMMPTDYQITISRGQASFSQMVTRAFSFTGSRMVLNMRSALRQWGAGPCEVRVQVLSPNHHPVPGYGFDDADPITVSGQAHAVSWNGSPDLSHMAGTAIKLRFYFKNAQLFSFQFR